MSQTPGFDEAESPLSRLAKPRGRQPAFLEGCEAMAGECLRVDFTRGQLMPGIGQRWDGMPRQRGSGSGAKDLSDTALDARGRVNGAVKAVGPELSGVLLDVCCFLKGLETVERERQWPARSAKFMLKAGLGILSRHYGFDREPGSAPGRIRRWATPDAKPRVGR